MPADEAQVWTGTTTGDAEQPLEVMVTLTRRGAWMGAYTIATRPPFTGEVYAVLDGQTLTGTLIVTRDCAYALAGSITDDSLTATFTPEACDGGSDEAGRAHLRRAPACHHTRRVRRDCTNTNRQPRHPSLDLPGTLR